MSEDGVEVRQNDVALLPIRVRAAWVAVPALQVVEVVDAGTPLPLPRAPSHIPGVLNLRGTALPLLDVGAFLGLPEAEVVTGTTAAFPRIVVVEAAEMTVGLQCLAVLGVIPAGDRVMRAPGSHSGILAEVAMGEVDLGEGIATTIDLAELLGRARVRS